MDILQVRKKRIVHLACGKQHVDRSFYSTFNHFKHYCEFCKKYFYDSEKAVGAEVE